MYMSYCKYEGTYYELSHCLRDAEEHINEEAEYEVSEGEIQHFRNMVELFSEFLHDNELLDEDGNLDYYALDKACEAMSKSHR